MTCSPASPAVSSMKSLVSTALFMTSHPNPRQPLSGSKRVRSLRRAYGETNNRHRGNQSLHHAKEEWHNLQRKPAGVANANCEETSSLQGTLPQNWLSLEKSRRVTYVD